MKKLFRVRNIIIIIIVVIAAFWVWKSFLGKNEQISYMTTQVARGEIRRLVNATGEVGPVQLVSVGAQVTGEIETLYVVLGQTVKKGDMIAQIDSTTQENDLKINQAKLESYQAQLESAKVDWEVARAQYERERKLIANNATSVESMENAESRLAAAKSRVTELASLIIQTQIAVNTAEVNLGYTRILSPLDGTVVSVPVEEGQTINANQTTPTIVQIADLTQMEILMEIAEGDITKIQPGMVVTYSVLSEPGKVYETALDSIDPGLTALTNGNYVKGGNTDTAVYYYGRLIVPNESGLLHIGMTTQNSIVIAHAEDVLIVPNLAVNRNGGKPFVRVLQHGQVVEKEIKTGISDIMNTEVLEGLVAGEEVITSQMSAKDIAEAMKSNMRGPGPRF